MLKGLGKASRFWRVALVEGILKANKDCRSTQLFRNFECGICHHPHKMGGGGTSRSVQRWETARAYSEPDHKWSARSTTEPAVSWEPQSAPSCPHPNAVNPSSKPIAALAL